MTKFFKSIGALALDILFPPVEIKNVRVHSTLFCAACRARLPDNKKICHRDTSYRLAAASDYEGEIKQFIWALKYNKKPGAVQPLGDLMKKYLEKANMVKRGEKGYAIVPIPLSHEREKERDYNQAELLAAEVGTFLSLPVINALKRTRDTKPQAHLENQEKRRENVKGCFALREDQKGIRGKNIIIVDDVFTSGATMDEAVKTLRAEGVRKVIALVAAKVVR